MTRKDNKISIVIPVYNEEQVIEKFSNRLFEELSSIESSFEVIFVDDGSFDHTIQKIKELQTKYHIIKLLAFTRNFGHQHALWAGIERATGSAVIMMDSDLQHPPSIIPKLIEKWHAGSLVVQTIRKDTKIPIFKNISSKLFYLFINVFSDVKLSPAAADFRLIDSVVVKELLKFKETDVFLRGLIPWLSFKTSYLEFESERRIAGKSKYSFFKMVKLALTGITSLSTIPLKFATLAGFIISLMSFYVGIDAIYARLTTDQAVPGWTSVMVGVFFIGGLSMIFMGILGEYLGKIFREVKRRPKYIVREALGFDDKE